MKIYFAWQGVTGRYGVWQDGLYMAMKHIEKEHTVIYGEPTGEIPADVDVILYWEAPCTINGKDKEAYKRIKNYPNKPKILLFAGGEIRADWVDGFSMLLVESQINEDDCERLGIPYMRAFGVNEELFVPMNKPKIVDAVYHATFADWKRHKLFAQAVGSTGVAIGRKQDFDLDGYNECVNRNVTIMPEMYGAFLVNQINNATVVLNTAEYWGGGQRCTLEAMACGIPPIVMSDSPKNCEYVRESGFGHICDPDTYDIQRTIDSEKLFPSDPQKGRDYIMSKWTSRHYADAILKAINEVV